MYEVWAGYEAYTNEQTIESCSVMPHQIVALHCAKSKCGC